MMTLAVLRLAAEINGTSVSQEAKRNSSALLFGLLVGVLILAGMVYVLPLLDGVVFGG